MALAPGGLERVFTKRRPGVEGVAPEQTVDMLRFRLDRKAPHRPDKGKRLTRAPCPGPAFPEAFEKFEVAGIMDTPERRTSEIPRLQKFSQPFGDHPVANHGCTRGDLDGWLQHSVGDFLPGIMRKLQRREDGLHWSLVPKRKKPARQEPTENS